MPACAPAPGLQVCRLQALLQAQRLQSTVAEERLQQAVVEVGEEGAGGRTLPNVGLQGVSELGAAGELSVSTTHCLPHTSL